MSVAEGTPAVLAFIQARMSSRRFPGKVLTAFRGRPLIAHVIDRAAAVVGRGGVVVVTSADTTDDRLATAVEEMGAAVFRGPLDNVLARFQAASRHHPSEWVLRLSGDSPLLDVALLRHVVDRAITTEHDLVTTIFPRTFPAGHNAEMIRRTVLLGADCDLADDHEREHVTPLFYRRADRYRILNITSAHPEWAQVSLAVDSAHDLTRLEAMSDEELERFRAVPVA